MSSANKNTLQIKSFKGVDRFIEGTERQPDVAQYIQNLQVLNPGELEALSGVTNIPNEIPGLQEIIHTKFLDTAKEKGLLVFYKPSTSLPAAPAANITFTPAAGIVFTVTVATPAVFTSASAHGLVSGARIVFSTTGALPTGLTAGTVYYVISAGLTATQFEVSATQGGAAINTTGTQSGVHSWLAVRDVYVQYVVAGGGRIGTKYANTPIPFSGVSPYGALTVNINNNVNGSAYYAVQSINVFIEALGDAVYWAGAAWRESNAFPASFPVYAAGSPPTTSLVSVGVPPGSLTLTATTGGTLEDDRIYYFGLGPAIGGDLDANAEVAFQTAASNLGGVTAAPLPFSMYLPKGYSAISAAFNYCPLNPADTTTVPVATDITLYRGIVYCGATPEDLMPATGLGYATTVAKSTSTSSTFADTAVVSNTILVAGGSGQIPVGACLKAAKTSGADITAGGSTMDGKYYYVVSSTFTASTGKSTIGLASSPGGTALALVTAGAAVWSFSWAHYTATISCLPKSLDRVACCGSWSTNATYVAPKAISGRGVGVVTLATQFSDAGLSDAPTQIACGMFTSLEFTFVNFRHIANPASMSAVNNANYRSTVVNLTTAFPFAIPIEDSAAEEIDWEFMSGQYGNRIWCVNDYNEPFYSNGYVLKTGIPSAPGSDTFARWPITKYITFIKDRMVLANDRGNQSYAEGYFYFSKLATGSGDIQNFSFNSTTPNVLPVNTSDQSKINGLFVYSQNLSTVGAQTYLVVGKEASIFTWDGEVTSAAKQITQATGLAGPKAYCLSKFGPVYVGRDNVYLLRSADDLTPIGDNIKDIIENLTEDQLGNVQAVFHEDSVKIAYQNATEIDRELWLRFIYRGGQIQKLWSGPHVRKSFIEQALIPSFDDQLNVRVSHGDAEFYRLDDPGSYLNDGLPMARAIQFSNLGLQFDHFWKLITNIYLALRVAQDESFDLTFESEDGSQSMVIQVDVTASGTVRLLSQTQIKQRFTARVFKLTIEQSSNGPLSFYDISILYQQIRRRLLTV